MCSGLSIPRCARLGWTIAGDGWDGTRDVKVVIHYANLLSYLWETLGCLFSLWYGCGGGGGVPQETWGLYSVGGPGFDLGVCCA